LKNSKLVFFLKVMTDTTVEMLEHISKYVEQHGRALLHDLVATNKAEKLEGYLNVLDGWVYKLFQNETLMETAMQHGSLDCARAIMRAGGDRVLVLTGDPKQTMLTHAIEAGSEPCIRFVLHHNLRLWCEPLSSEHSPLHLCVNTFVRPALLKVVLEKIRYVNQGDAHGWTALTVAIELGNVTAAIALVEDPRVDVVRAQTGIAPLHRAAMHGNILIVEAMAKREDVRSLCNMQKHRLLLDAIQMKHRDILAIFLNTAAFSTSIHFVGEPLSHYAAGVGMLDTVMTHDKGFDCMIQDEESGNTLVHVLATQYYTKEKLSRFLRVIATSPPDPKAIDCPVVLAARGGWPMEVFEAFLRGGYTLTSLCWTVQMNGLAPFDRRSALDHIDHMYWFLRACAGKLPVGGHVPMGIEIANTQSWTAYECACYGGVSKPIVDHLLQLVGNHGFMWGIKQFALVPTTISRKVLAHIFKRTQLQEQLMVHGQVAGGWTPYFHASFSKAEQRRVHSFHLACHQIDFPRELTQLILSYMTRSV
jgi:hypothetical protein